LKVGLDNFKPELYFAHIEVKLEAGAAGCNLDAS
jgi:hypothetical protein